MKKSIKPVVKNSTAIFSEYCTIRIKLLTILIKLFFGTHKYLFTYFYLIVYAITVVAISPFANLHLAPPPQLTRVTVNGKARTNHVKIGKFKQQMLKDHNCPFSKIHVSDENASSKILTLFIRWEILGAFFSIIPPCFSKFQIKNYFLFSLLLFFKLFYCCSITVVCIFCPPLPPHPSQTHLLTLLPPSPLVLTLCPL